VRYVALATSQCTRFEFGGLCFVGVKGAKFKMVARNSDY